MRAATEAIGKDARDKAAARAAQRAQEAGRSESDGCIPAASGPSIRE